MRPPVMVFKPVSTTVTFHGSAYWLCTIISRPFVKSNVISAYSLVELEKWEDILNLLGNAEKELTDAKEKILEIENPTWYVLDRNSNAGYVSFIQDTESIANIGKVFPIVRINRAERELCHF